MAEKNERKPELRFKGFEGEWDRRKLKDFLDVSDEKNREDIYTKEDVLSVSGEYGIVNQIQFQGRSFAGASVSNYGIVHTGDIVYTKSPLNTNPYGIIKANKGKTGVVSTLYAIYHPKNNVYSNFVQNYFEHHARMNNYMRPLVNKGAKNDMKVSAEHALDGYVCFPNYNEQQVISNLFDMVDSSLIQEQQRYTSLQNLKKAMLEKMFPRDGADVPELRFKGFEGAWGRRRLGDYLIEYTEVTSKNNQHPPLTSSRKGIFLQTEYFAGNQIASVDNTGYNIVPYGYFTYRHMSDDEIFHFNINNIVEYGIVSTLYPVFTTDGRLDSQYLQYQLNYGDEFAKFAVLQKQGGSRTYMYLNKLRQLYLTMPPSINEQQKIAEYFQNLDSLISNQQKKINHLKHLKSALLEKMFVSEKAA